MPASPRTFTKGKLKLRSIEATAFYLGAHLIDPAPVLEQIEARFTEESLEEKQQPLRALHALEAKRERVRREKPEAEALWQRIRKEYGDTPPPYFQAVLMAFFALFALALDTLFLAPTMDILNVAGPALQFLAAAGLAVLCTAFFELTGLLFLRADQFWPKRFLAIAVGTVGTASLTLWGLLRGAQLHFAALYSGNPLGQFLGLHPVLTAVFFIFITLTTPLIGATALLYCWTEVSHARTWRRVRERFTTLRAAEIELARQVQTEAEQLAQFDERKQAECREWKAVFAEFYERGQRNGARQESRRAVIGKSLLGGLCAMPIAFLVSLVWLPSLLVVPAASGLACFLYFSRRRIHPSQERYLKAENTHFAVVPDTPEPRELRAHEQKLLPKGGTQ
jgi:Flp pilus assembly protein TadB